MLWTIAVILLLLWMFGFMFSVAGNLVHVLLVIAAIVVVGGTTGLWFRVRLWEGSGLP